MSRTATLRESTSIPYEIKVILDSLEMSEERPAALSKWAKKVFAESNKFGRELEEVAGWVEEYASEKDYSDRQIRRVLKDNGYVKSPERTNKSRKGDFNYIIQLKHLCQAMTELDDTSIISARPGRAISQATV